MSDIRAAKRPVLSEIAARLTAMTWPGGATPRVRRNADAVGAEFVLSDDATALLFVATYKVGLPAGQFVIAPSAHLRGGEIWRQLRRQGALSSDNSWLVSLNTTLLPEGRDYLSPTPSGTATALRFLTTVAPPILQSFLTDWTRALAFATDHPQFLSNPKATPPAIRRASSA